MRKNVKKTSNYCHTQHLSQSLAKLIITALCENIDFIFKSCIVNKLKTKRRITKITVMHALDRKTTKSSVQTESGKLVPGYQSRDPNNEI